MTMTPKILFGCLLFIMSTSQVDGPPTASNKQDLGEAPRYIQSVDWKERLQKRSFRHQRSRDAQKNGLKEQNICHLEDIPNGVPKDERYEYSVGEEASISCHLYYTLHGPQKVKCLQDGTMTERPTCVPIHYCSKFAELLNGIVNQTKWPKPGETANFDCNNGYRLNGVSTTTCQPDGNWDLERIPVCEERKIGSGSSTNPILAICALVFCICSFVVYLIILRKQKKQYQAKKEQYKIKNEKLEQNLREVQLEKDHDETKNENTVRQLQLEKDQDKIKNEKTVRQLQLEKDQDKIKNEKLEQKFREVQLEKDHEKINYEKAVRQLQLEIQQNHVKARLDETDEQRATGQSNLGIHVGVDPYPAQTQASEVVREEPEEVVQSTDSSSVEATLR